MYITILIYYIIYNFFLFSLIPTGALFYLRPLFVILLGTIFTIPTIFIKKRFLPIFILIINIGFCLILGEFGRVSIKTSVIITILTTLILVLIYLNRKITRRIGFTFLFLLIVTSLWQGKKLKYRSNLTMSNKNYTGKILEYGEQTTLKTYSIDSSSYYKGNKGLPGWYDKEYWGITTNLPLNGRMFYPEKPGKYPLILIVHGNHLSEIPSQRGYDYLLKNLASKGYIAVSIDQNFLNGNWTTTGVGLPKENDARGYLLLEHLALMEKWNTDPDSKLYNKIDMKNIGLIGHSRGGEAISIAAAKGPQYKIKALMALAPTDRQFREDINLMNISYITLHGANDGDLSSFKGRGQYNRTIFNTNNFNFKASYFIEGVNHSQFNTDWGNVDSTGPGKVYYGTNNNIKNIDQQEIAKMLSYLFFEITLKGKTELIPYIKNPQLIKTLPIIKYITDYSDSNLKSLYNFSFSDPSIVINPGLDHEYIYRRNNRSLKLTWFKTSSITFNNKLPNTDMKDILISIASNRYNEQTIEISLIKNQDKIYTKRIKLPGGIKKKIFKTDFFQIDKIEIEPHFQFFTIPAENWDKMEVTFIDKTGSVIIDNISCNT